jgi:hypothetical protein
MTTEDIAEGRIYRFEPVLADRTDPNFKDVAPGTLVRIIPESILGLAVPPPGLYYIELLNGKSLGVCSEKSVKAG